jgi:DUSP domain/Ubiquitin carboxyl-terminal hydrolase
VLYCVDRVWWDAWATYVRWSWAGDPGAAELSGAGGSPPQPPPPNARRRKRPGELSTESLLERNGTVLGGVHGSYELMKHGLRQNVDYVLVPPGVWDVLYELYGGGPPLPRMVKPCGPRKLGTDYGRSSTEMTGDSSHHMSYQKMAQDLDSLVLNLEPNRVPPLPDSLSVVLHPWLIQVHLCDPSTPYRRGEVGLLSIRVMATPDQPLWRLFAESIVRFPLHSFKAFVNGRGKARLWKRTDRGQVSLKAPPVSRYGPWNPLCKSREAILPQIKGSTASRELARDYEDIVANWKAYTDNATVEGSGLVDNDHLMLEFATVGKSGELLWPRDAAAKAGRVRRLAEEDMYFRQTLQGVDEKGSLVLKPPQLVGMKVDGLNSSGRWYPVTILEVDIFDDDTDDELAVEHDAAASNKAEKSLTRKKVRVDFTEHGGHEEWIDVESDRLAVHGRFTSDAERQNGAMEELEKVNPSASSDVKPKLGSPATRKNSGINDSDNGKICVWPGFGACGLTNLGNTCYVNSAIQCISYLPLLRSYLLSSQYKTNGDLNRDNPLGTGGKLLEEFVELLRANKTRRSS